MFCVSEARLLTAKSWVDNLNVTAYILLRNNNIFEASLCRAGKLRVHHYHIHRTEGGTNLSNGHTSGGANGNNSTASNSNVATINGNIGTSVNGNSTGGSGGGSAEPQFYLSEKHAFPTISEVIHYHKHNSGGLVVRLRSPPVKDRESPVTAGMGLDEFELDPAELQIDPEPIGKGQFGVSLIESEANIGIEGCFDVSNGQFNNYLVC